MLYQSALLALLGLVAAESHTVTVSLHPPAGANGSS